MTKPASLATRARQLACAFALLLGGLPGVARADTVDARCDIHATGQERATRIVACTFSQRQGHVRIQRSDGVAHDLTPTGTSPGNFVDQDGKPAYRQRGLGDRGQIYRLSRESVYVYWDTAGLPVPAATGGTRTGPIALPPALPASVPFDQTLRLQGVGFRVTSDNAGQANQLTIVPTGLAIDNSPIVRAIEGQVIRAEVADLNADGSPEIYVYVRSVGPEARGSLVAYSANRRRSLSEIVMTPLSDMPAASSGYRGHDDFAVVKNRLTRSFPVYAAADSDASPSGGVRVLHFKLVPGEASWRLVLDRAVSK